jgi:endonuclease/exonuclease/phosphatase family metal-dependent hydrolase
MNRSLDTRAGYGEAMQRAPAIISRDDVTIASLNMHGGVSRLGQPFDIEAACHHLKADVIALQETWRPDGQPDPLAAAAHTFGAQVKQEGLAVGTDLASLRVGPGTAPGTWGLAVLTRLPITGYEVVSLGKAPGDRIHRVAQVVTVTTPGGAALRVANTHLTHRFTSPVQLRRLIRHLAAGAGAVVIVGDLNMPRAATLAAIGYSRAVRGRTFPAHRPLVQLDHVLAGAGTAGISGEVLEQVGSDHLPILAQVSVA